jgi:hypothetical protein
LTITDTKPLQDSISQLVEGESFHHFPRETIPSIDQRIKGQFISHGDWEGL